MSSRAALSPPRAGHPDLVAVVDDRRAAQQVEQVVAEQVALQQRVAGAALACARICCAARPMSWLPRKVGGVGAIPSAPEVVVVLEPRRIAARRRLAAGEPVGRVLHREVEQVRQPAVADERDRSTRVEASDLAEHLEVGHAGGACRREDPRQPEPEERRRSRAVPCRSRKPSSLYLLIQPA